MTATDRVDVLVAGGGPAGAAAAITAARAGLRVALVEPRGGIDWKVGEGLPPAARRLLRALGALDSFLTDGHASAWALQSLWGSPQLAYLDGLHDPDGHGWHLDRAQFDARLRAEAQAAGACLRPGWRVAGVRSDGGSANNNGDSDGFVAQLEAAGERTTVAARWLVDATGHAARFARQLGASRCIADRLVAFGLTLDAAADDQDGTTCVEAVPEGWWYTVRLPAAGPERGAADLPAGCDAMPIEPLAPSAAAQGPRRREAAVTTTSAGGRRLVIFLTDHDLPAARQARSRHGFAALLARTREVARRLPAEPSEPSEPSAALAAPRAFAAVTQRLLPPCGDGWIAVGDAALATDPLASQGILSALYSGLLAGQAIAAAEQGDGGPWAAYPSAIAAVHDAFWRHRRQYYGLERRFAGEPFWQRRHEARTGEPLTADQPNGRPCGQ